MNCRWATMAQQMNNKRTNRLITVDGVTLTATEWSKRLGVSTSLLFGRIKRGMDPMLAVIKVARNYQ